MPGPDPDNRNDGRQSRSRRSRRRASDEWRQQYGLIGVVRQTRKPISLWDRSKFLILLVAIWFIVVWYQMANNPILGFVDASRQQLELRAGFGRWLVLLLIIEALRQLSYLIAEHIPWYYRLSTGAFGRGDRVTGRVSDYTRFRISRAA
jgi:cell division protease FtsH